MQFSYIVQICCLSAFAGLSLDHYIVVRQGVNELSNVELDLIRGPGKTPRPTRFLMSCAFPIHIRVQNRQLVKGAEHTRQFYLLMQLSVSIPESDNHSLFPGCLTSWRLAEALRLYMLGMRCSSASMTAATAAVAASTRHLTRSPSRKRRGTSGLASPSLKSVSEQDSAEDLGSKQD